MAPMIACKFILPWTVMVGLAGRCADPEFGVFFTFGQGFGIHFFLDPESSHIFDSSGIIFGLKIPHCCELTEMFFSCIKNFCKKIYFVKFMATLASGWAC
jgi:hypothetical protein